MHLENKLQSCVSRVYMGCENYIKKSSGRTIFHVFSKPPPGNHENESLDGVTVSTRTPGADKFISIGIELNSPGSGKNFSPL